MTIITQDGRTLDIDRKFHLHISGFYKSDDRPARLTLTTFTKRIGHFRDGSSYETGDKLIEDYGIIGSFSTNTACEIVRNNLKDAWNHKAPRFIIPQDFDKMSDAERFDDFCQLHGLTCASINELGYESRDEFKIQNRWRNSNDFERRNILVADDDADLNAFGGHYSTSLEKWCALNNVAIPA